MNSSPMSSGRWKRNAARQIALVESGQRVDQVTLLFNAGTGQVKPIRSKEESHDYRYFPIRIYRRWCFLPAWIDEQRAALPELPEAKRARWETEYALPGE